MGPELFEGFKRIKEWIQHQAKSFHLCREHNVHLLPGNLQICMPAKRNQKYWRRSRPLAGLFQSRSWHNDGLQRAMVLMMWRRGHASNLGQTLSQKDTPKSLADDASTKKRTREWDLLNYTQASTSHLQTDVSKMLAKKWRSHVIEQSVPVPNTLYLSCYMRKDRKYPQNIINLYWVNLKEDVFNFNDQQHININDFISRVWWQMLTHISQQFSMTWPHPDQSGSVCALHSGSALVRFWSVRLRQVLVVLFVMGGHVGVVPLRCQRAAVRTCNLLLWFFLK